MAHDLNNARKLVRLSKVELFPYLYTFTDKLCSSSVAILTHTYRLVKNMTQVHCMVNPRKWFLVNFYWIWVLDVALSLKYIHLV